MQESWSRSHHSSRFETPVCNAVYRIGRGYSDRFAVARTQGWRSIGNENVRALATRAQHRSSTARYVRAYRDKPSGRNCISRDGVIAAAKRRLICRKGWRVGRHPPNDGGLCNRARRNFSVVEARSYYAVRMTTFPVFGVFAYSDWTNPSASFRASTMSFRL